MGERNTSWRRDRKGMSLLAKIKDSARGESFSGDLMLHQMKQHSSDGFIRETWMRVCQSLHNVSKKSQVKVIQWRMTESKGRSTLNSVSHSCRQTLRKRRKSQCVSFSECFPQTSFSSSERVLLSNLVVQSCHRWWRRRQDRNQREESFEETPYK